MIEPLRVLLIEDSDSDAKLVTRALGATGRELEIERVETADAMRSALGRVKFDVVISDWSLPTFGASAALGVLQAAGLDLPYIIVSGTVGEDTAVEAMRAGAHDYVLKDKLARLAPAIERELREREARDARRSADEALRLEQSRFRALIERNDEGIALTDQGTRILYASPGAKRILGIVERDPVGDLIGTWVHPDDRAAVAAFGVRLRSAPLASETTELRLVRSDGVTRWVEATLVNRLDDPAVAAVVTNFRDITDRKAARDALRESETRFRRLWESGMVGIAIAEPAGRYVDANDAMLEMVGYTRDDLAAGKLRSADMTPPEWQHTTATATAELERSGSARPWEKEYIRKDGSRVPVLVGVASLSAARRINLVIDLSPLKHAEEDRRRAESALHLTESQLRQAQKMEAIGRLAGGVAHDFNNLLSVILSYSQFVLEALKPGDPMRDDLDEICKAGVRAAEVTAQLLTFSRQQVIETKIVDLNDVLTGMDKMLRRVLGEDVELVSVARQALALVEVDRSSFEQVLMNLAVNARDAMPTGGRLTIETDDVVLDAAFAREHVGVQTGPHVRLAVSDTGAGMDSATQAHIFEPFFTTKEVGKGTGLGLSTVFGIVHQSGGTIWVRSEPGKGASFTIYVPRAAGEVGRDQPAMAPTDLGGTETILLVEDEDAVRGVARAILQRGGYKVLEARNAGEALLHSEGFSGTIDLLLTDVVMPQMSGPALADRLASARPGMKVICMSGYTDDTIVRHGALDSAIGYLQKPLTPQTLMRRVRATLDAPRRAPN